MSDSLAFDQRKDVIGARRLREHHARTLPEEAADAGARQGEVVRDRQRDQQAVVRVHVVHCDCGFRVVHVIVVRARDQLGHASRTSRQLEDARFVGINLDSVEESGIQRRLIAQQLPNRFGAEDSAHSRMGFADLRDQRPRVEVTERLGDGVSSRF